MEHPDADPLRARRRRILITGGDGQVGSALAASFGGDDVVSLTRREWDVTKRAPEGLACPDVVLHTAAWTDVDGAEAEPNAAEAVNVGGVANAAALGAPLVVYSTDYVFDGEKHAPYVESDTPRPLSVYGTTKLAGEAVAGATAWVVRTSWVFGVGGRNFVSTILRLARERDELAVVDDQRGSPTYAPHLAAATRTLVDTGAPFGIWHLTADGDCTWAELAEAIVARAGLDCRIVRTTTSALARPARRPAYSVLRSEKGAPTLPHWREGLAEFLAASALPRPV